MLVRKPRPLALPLTLAVALWVVPAALRAQFGTVELSTVIPTGEFTLASTNFTYINEGFTYFQATSGNPATFVASTNVPVGAKVNQVCVFAKDNHTNGQVSVDFGVIELGDAGVAPTVSSLTSAGSGNSETPGYQLVCASLASGHTIRAFGDGDGAGGQAWLSYRVLVSLEASPSLSFGGALIKWQRQQAPAPGAATFSDVPTTFLFFRAIENLAAAGITGGCGPGQFCPNNNITRGEAAAFFSKALGLNWPQ